MRVFIYILFGLILAAAIVSLVCFWDWVTNNGALTAGLITSFILLMAFTGALISLNEVRRDRATSIAMAIREHYDTGIILEARELVLRINNELDKIGAKKLNKKRDHLQHILNHYRTNYPEGFVKLHSIPAFFDLIGWLVRRGCCDAKAIKEQIEVETPFRYWENYIRQVQGKSKTDFLDTSPTSYYGNFVWLAKKLRGSN